MTVLRRTVAVIGGGLAGISAAESAVRHGWLPAVFERAAVLGGRVASLREPNRNVWIDIGQHLILGCSSEALLLNQRLGLDPFFQKEETLTFAGTQHRHWKLSAARWLPKEWQLLPSLLSMPSLPFSERVKTGLLLRKLSREDMPEGTIADWLNAHAVSANALDAFWSPLILSSLSETANHAAAAAVQRVVKDAFCAGRENMSAYIPTVPLRAIYHDAAAAALTERGVSLRFFKRLRRLHWEEENGLPKIAAVEFSDNSVEEFDYYVLAIPPFALWKVLDASNLSGYADQLGLNRFEPCSISTVHLWLDRPLLKEGKKCCVLQGGTGQFLCCANASEHYYTVVISASHRILPDEEMTVSGSRILAERILEQLRQTFVSPALQAVHYRVTTSFEAVFSPNPSVFANRPAPFGWFSNAMIAGDWTVPNYPATLEGAVRSGKVCT